MGRFLRFLIEEEVKFHRDNPGGEWLKHKHEDAETHYKKKKGLHGGTTGWFSPYPHLPVSHLKKIPGANDEHYTRESKHSQKSQHVEKQIGHPSKFDTKKYPIMVGVNHRGEAHVMEGNHRLGYAVRHGISHVHTEFKYYNGGEDVHGSHHPSIIKKLHKAED